MMRARDVGVERKGVGCCAWRDWLERVRLLGAVPTLSFAQLILHGVLVAAPEPPERGRLLYLAVGLIALRVAGRYERLLNLGLTLVGGAGADQVNCLAKFAFRDAARLEADQFGVEGDDEIASSQEALSA